MYLWDIKIRFIIFLVKIIVFFRNVERRVILDNMKSIIGSFLFSG